MSLINELLSKFPTLQKTDIDKGIKYLQDYAHLNGSVDDQSIIDATKSFQEYSDLDQDGLLGPKTLRAMTALRCGVKDVLHLRTEEAKWRKNSLTYFIESYDSDLSKAKFDEIIYQAFQAWCKIADLKIEPTNTKKCDILVGTGRGRSSDFDGPSGTLAWAELPNGNNQQLLLKFDLDETWVDSPNKRGILLLNVATHEMGHNLGLQHSKLNNQLMSPYYSAAVATPQSEDETRIQELYGKPRIQPPVEPKPEPTPVPPTEEYTMIKIYGKIERVEVPGFRSVKTQQ